MLILRAGIVYGPCVSMAILKNNSFRIQKRNRTAGLRPSAGTGNSAQQAVKGTLMPFLNRTTMLLMRWFYTGHKKSFADLGRLVDDVMLHDDFDREELRGFNPGRATRDFDRHIGSSSAQNNDPDHAPSLFSAADGWLKGSINIHLPKERKRVPSEQDAPSFTVTGFYYRKFTEVIRAAYRNQLAEKFHISPFRQFFDPNSVTTSELRTDDESTFPAMPQPDSATAQRIYSEVFDSNVMNDEYEKLRLSRSHLPPEPEPFIIPIILYSDSTHLADFGTASLWPIYIFFGGLSKYLRGKPSSFAAHHLAYVPSVRTDLVLNVKDT